jgi:hypothetical protein
VEKRKRNPVGGMEVKWWGRDEGVVAEGRDIEGERGEVVHNRANFPRDQTIQTYIVGIREGGEASD